MLLFKKYLVFFFCVLASLLMAQQEDGSQEDSTEQIILTNPFDLDHRSQNRRNNYNPFDVSRSARRNINRLEDISKSPVITKPENEKLSNFNFLLYSGILILFTFLFTLYRALLVQVYKSLLNENILKLLHREQIDIVKFEYIIWYLFFFLSLGAFIFQLANAFNPSIEVNLWWLYGQILLAITVLVVLKHLVLMILGYVFPIKKELGIYSFSFILFNIILGLALVPINLLIAFGPVSGYKALLYIGLGLCVFIAILGILRVLSMTSSKWVQYLFHFFIYLCAVEIAPIIVLVKLVMSSQ